MLLEMPRSFIPSLPPSDASVPPKRSSRATEAVAATPTRPKPAEAVESLPPPSAEMVVEVDIAAARTKSSPAAAETVTMVGKDDGKDDDDAETAAAEPPARDLEEEAREMARTHTIRDLRDKCTERGLSSAGKKSELVQRLLDGGASGGA